MRFAWVSRAGKKVEYVHHTNDQKHEENILKDAACLMLREAWKEEGKSDRHHPEFHEERSISGTVTGCYSYSTCGQFMRVERVQAEVKRMA